MYTYEHDPQTGGLLLTDTPSKSSKEPRPVYAQELDLLGMDQIWKYDAQSDVPYMWAESNHYIYRGQVIFNTTGATLYKKPVVEPVLTQDTDGLLLPAGTHLQAVDLASMTARNQPVLDALEQETLRKIYNAYQHPKERLDAFHVAFSGGKDSMVLLDLVRRALPAGSFIVVFGDTGMEFPDTYRLVDEVEKACREAGIPFYRSSSRFTPEESWHLFGPPATTLRWCCSVHKSAPQTLKLREVLGKNNFVGLDFVGVRAAESAARSSYTEDNFGRKQRGQYSHNPILSWTSAEVWLYTYAHGLLINETYKKGNARAGCLLCPMSGDRANSFRNLCYPDGVERLTNLIRDTVVDDNIDTYISRKGWTCRRNGRDLAGNDPLCIVEETSRHLAITVRNPSTDWREWIKTLGNVPFSYSVRPTEDGYVVRAPVSIARTTEGKLFRQVFHKAAYCVGCGVCESNCRNGCISFEGGLHIEGCMHCKECHNIDRGCLRYHSLELPKYGERAMRKASLNTLADHAPKPDWLSNFFSLGDSYWDSSGLGPMQIEKFKYFLRDAQLLDKSGRTTDFYIQIRDMGWDTAPAWNLILVELAYANRQMRWYVEHMPVCQPMARTRICDALQAEGVSEKDATSIVKAFGRLADIPLGTVAKFGSVEKVKKSITMLQREKAAVPDARALLYALYRYAEESGAYYQFSLDTLLDTSAQGDGISPAALFGLGPEDMEAMLGGLSAQYNDFIDATFTHGLDKVSLRDKHTAQDVLALFEDGNHE